MEYLTFFKTFEEYNVVKDGLPKPQVSYIGNTKRVYYKPYVKEFSISVSSLDINVDGGSYTVLVTSTSPWSASTTDNWITISPSSGDSGITNVTVSVGATSIQREGTVSFTDGVNTKTLTVSQTVVDYSTKYLTLEILTGGTLSWATSGSNVERTISYSKDNGETWTDLTSSSSGTELPVESGDEILLKGTNSQYGTTRNTMSYFKKSSAYFNAKGNIMSLIGGDDFVNLTTFDNKQYVFHNFFMTSNIVSAKNLVLPVMSVTAHCYRAMFANCAYFEEAPELPATTMQERCYSYMFQNTLIRKAPILPAETLATQCYMGMFEGCDALDYINCKAVNKSANGCLQGWVTYVSKTGTFVKNSESSSWSVGNSGIPSGWSVCDESLYFPEIECNGSVVTITCETDGASIHYRLDETGTYSAYTTSLVITADTIVEAYSTKDGNTSQTIKKECVYDDMTIYEYSNRSIDNWTYTKSGSTAVTVPYSINGVNGQAPMLTQGNFIFDSEIQVREAEPTYLWFQHADQTSTIYINDVKADTHKGGYNAFFSDITDYVHSGTNKVSVVLNNRVKDSLAPSTGDFNRNATLGKVKVFASTVMPSMNYGYDGFHITSTVSSAEATVYIKTKIPSGATVICKIDDGNTNVFTDTKSSNGNELTFTTTISNPHLWNGTIDPHLYTVTMEVYKGADLVHRYVRPYGFRFYRYALNETITVNGETIENYNGFLLNGVPYSLRGFCVHDDLANKANALSDSDYTQEFNIIKELGCNFLRLAHYPHPKEVYDKCDELGIVVQTEVPWVNQSTLGAPSEYWDSIETSCIDMVNQHYNHPCILFWGVGNEINSSFNESSQENKTLVNGQITRFRNKIRELMPNALVGYTVSHKCFQPLNIFNSPTVDWVGCNIYEGWYQHSGTTSIPSVLSGSLESRITHTIGTGNTPLAFSEYGAGGTQHCHSDNPFSTTTRGGGARHDIEYQMWLHEGHISTIKNYPELLFVSAWQLFDIAVTSRTEGFDECLDGQTVTVNNNLKYLNNKGIVERDHVTKKDTFYLYKAEWSQTKFVHICGKDYTKKTSRKIKCYTNDGDSLSLYVNDPTMQGSPVATTSVTNHIAEFEAINFSSNDVITVKSSTSSDTFTFA